MSLCSNTFRMQWLLLVCFYHVTLLLLRNLLLSKQMESYNRGPSSSANAENAVHTPTRVARDGIAYSEEEFAIHYGPKFRLYWDEADEAACSATGEYSSASSDEQGCSQDVKEAFYQFANHEGALPAEKQATVVASSLVPERTPEEKQAAAERDIRKLHSEECSWTKPSVPEKDSDAIHVWREWDKYMHPDTFQRWWYNRNTGEAIYVPPWTLPQCDRGCKLKKPQCDPFRYQ